jgi:hypothetical protein
MGPGDPEPFARRRHEARGEGVDGELADRQPPGHPEAISQTTYYLYGPSVSAVAAWAPYVKNFGPNIGHDTGGRIMAAWLDK